jgi:hypothetical protein
MLMSANKLVNLCENFCVFTEIAFVFWGGNGSTNLAAGERTCLTIFDFGALRSTYWRTFARYAHSGAVDKKEKGSFTITKFRVRLVTVLKRA